MPNPQDKSIGTEKVDKKQRLSEALRANLRKRKEVTKARKRSDSYKNDEE